MNIIEACQHPEIFAPWFKRPETYAGWFAFLTALFGLPMDEEQLELYRRHTGRTEPPTEAQKEAWLVIGRRGGKSFHMALIAVYLACFREYSQYLAPGERATILTIATDRRQARVIMRYIAAMLNNIPVFQAMVQRETADSFDLDNFATLEVGTASFRSTRGYSYGAVLCDELDFWRTDDAAEPDFAILDAIRPGMASIPTSLLLCASSPHARRGSLWDAFRRYWAKDDAPLVWRATTRQMNPSIPQEVVDRALERDQASASAEYMAEFRSDIEAFVTLEVVEACVTPGAFERPYVSGIRYQGFVDPSGGSNDSMTLAISHNEGGRVILDCTRERKPPFSPESVVLEFADTLKLYRVNEVEGDRYAGEWPREQFRKKGISYKIAEKVRSDLYRDMLPILNSCTAELLDSPRLVSQIVGLERRVHRGGKESIDHAPGGHDDLANAVAGALNASVKPRGGGGEIELVGGWY
jgi:hypothetical protein